jgi:branched-subunit amino acid transport protein
MTTWLVIVAVGAGSYVMRALPVMLSARWTGTPRVERTIAHAGTAALAALIAGGFQRAATTPTDIAAVVLAAAVALYIAVRGGSMARILLTGGLAYGIALASAWLLA